MMTLKVGELDEYLAKRQESTVTAKLNEFSTDDEATELRVKTGLSETTTFILDDTATDALAKYLGVPSGYLKKAEPDWRAEILNHEFARHQDVTTSVESLAGNLISVHQPTQTMLPLARVGQVIAKVMSPEDTIRRVLTDDKRFHLDATTSGSVVSFPTPEGVGDVTEGGLRVLAYPFQIRKPSVAAYLERLICTNGMVQEERFGAITLKGRTVDEVILEMEEAAHQVLGSLDEHLQNYADTRQMTPPGSPQAFAAQLAREANVPRKVLDEILARINQLADPVSIWDVNQVFTSVANESAYANMVRLQAIGGHLGMNAEKTIQRCKTCEQKLPS
jgi:hypothetical protein